MLKIKHILFVLVLVSLSGCMTEQVARKHLPTISQAGKFPYGGWISAQYKMEGEYTALASVSGELIAYQDDKLYILDSMQTHVIPAASVQNATLYIYKTQPGLFAAFSLIMIMPNIIAALAMPEYAGEFMALAIIPIVTGTIFTIREGSVKRNRLFYPEKNSLLEFIKFSRFPQGIPEEVKIEDLQPSMQ